MLEGMRPRAPRLRRPPAPFAACVLALFGACGALAVPLGWGPSRDAAAARLARFGPVDTITEGALRAHLRFIASDALQGRHALSPGFRVAAEYVAAHLASIDAVPAGDAGGFLQRVPLDLTGLVSDAPVEARGFSRAAEGAESLRGDSWNVIAVIPGRDPERAGEYVALGAHLDHLGQAPHRSLQDAIYNGADDDGSGVVALLAMAEAVARGPRPRRSLLFVWHTGEEQGGFGARYFLDHPTVPIDRIVAQLNLDMVGRSRASADRDPRNAALSRPGEIYLVGARRLGRELGDICERVSRELPGLTLNDRYDDPADSTRIYERSDHYEYARRGIPSAFFFSGLHAEYHETSDEIGAIDFVKLRAVTQTVLATAWALAEADAAGQAE